MKTKISMTPWKKFRIPRKEKKDLVKKGFYKITQKLISIANFGRIHAYKTTKKFMTL